MKLQDLLSGYNVLHEAPNNGQYAAVVFSEKTINQLLEYIKLCKIPGALDAGKFHTTVLYSTKPCPNYAAAGEISPYWIGTSPVLEVWKSRGDVPKNCLVVKYRCKKLVDRHNFLMNAHQASYDFDEYKPHITLSYDIGDVDSSKFADIADIVTDIEIVREYGELLDTDWKDKASTK